MYDRDRNSALTVRTVQVADTDSGIRLDRWFRRHYPNLTHGRLEKLLRTGQIRVDGRRVKASTRLEAGQVVRVPPLDEGKTRPPRTGPPPDARDLERVRDLVIHRDDDVLVINKPPGLAVQGGTGVTRHLDALLDGLRYGAPERPRLVHRLDKDTSGILLLGRSAKAAAQLAAVFRTKQARKVYWALTAGVPKPGRGRIDLSLAKGRSAAGDRVGPDEDRGRRAVTDYAVLDRAGRRAAWLALMPLTGRTHQLRVHCAAMGTPILGDGKYGGRNAFISGLPSSHGLMLHARSITIPHPDGATLHVAAPLPGSMAKIWRFLGFEFEGEVDPFAGSEP